MIRKVTNFDAKKIADIYNYYIVNSVATFEEKEITSEEISKRIARDKLSGLPWIVAEDNQEIVGYAYATEWNKRSAYRFTVETTVYLLNSAVSKGWGNKLYGVLYSELKNMNVHMVIGGITLPNQVSVALHEKFGMKKVAHFSEVGFKFNKWHDVGYWQVQLDV